MAHSRLTVVFAKRPVAGLVKTRLCPPLAPEEAAELALAMLDDALARCRASTAFETLLAGAPAEDLDWFAERYGGRSACVAQRGGGLGERLANAFHDLLPGRASVVVIGADAPLLAAEAIDAAHRALEQDRDAVFVPDGGGGYALVGLRREVPELFLDVAMSTPENFARTLDVARVLGLAFEILPECRDVDGPEDLTALAQLLERHASRGDHDSQFPTHTFACLRRMGRVRGCSPEESPSSH